MTTTTVIMANSYHEKDFTVWNQQRGRQLPPPPHCQKNAIKPNCEGLTTIEMIYLVVSQVNGGFAGIARSSYRNSRTEKLIICSTGQLYMYNPKKRSTASDGFFKGHFLTTRHIAGGQKVTLNFFFAFHG